MCLKIVLVSKEKIVPPGTLQAMLMGQGLSFFRKMVKRVVEGRGNMKQSQDPGHRKKQAKVEVSFRGEELCRDPQMDMVSKHTVCEGIKT